MPQRKPRKQGGKKKETQTPQEKVKLTELDKTILTGQIKSLEEKLKHCQTKWRETDVSCQTYKLQVEQVTNDKQNIVSFLRQNLDQRADEITELQERLQGLQTAREDDNQKHKQQVQHLKAQYQEMKDQLTSENIVLIGKLTSLEEFKSQKEEILAKMETLNDKLKKQEEGHRETVRNIERRNILEKDKLKKEMKQKLEEVASKFRQISNRHMSETTRRAIQENAALSLEMEKMADKLSKVQTENHTLAETSRQQGLRIVTLEGTESELVKRNCFLAKQAKENEAKLKLQSTAVHELRVVLTKCSQLEQQIIHLQSEIKMWKDEAMIKRQTSDNTLESLHAVTHRLKMEEEHSKKLEDILIDATNALKDGLDIDSSASIDDITISKESILSHVLAILNEAKQVREMMKTPTKDSETKDFQTKELTKLKQNKREPATMLETGYFTGDIGLIPCPHTTPNLLALLKLHRRTGIDRFTQTEMLPEPTPAHSSLSSMRMVKSAAFRVLQETKCPSTYVDSFRKMPRKH